MVYISRNRSHGDIVHLITSRKIIYFTCFHKKNQASCVSSQSIPNFSLLNAIQMLAGRYLTTVEMFAAVFWHVLSEQCNISFFIGINIKFNVFWRAQMWSVSCHGVQCRDFSVLDNSGAMLYFRCWWGWGFQALKWFMDFYVYMRRRQVCTCL